MSASASNRGTGSPSKLSSKRVQPLPFSILVPLGGMKVSTNKIYAGIHWSKRANIADGFTGLIRFVCSRALPVGQYPVQIRYRFFFAKQPLDTTNCAFMAKCLEDALRAVGVLEEDDPAHVAATVLEVPPRSADGSGDPATHTVRDQASRGGRKLVREDMVEITISPYKQ